MIKKSSKSEIDRICSQILAIYKDIDKKIVELKRKTGLGCERGCGECCYSYYIET